MPNMYATSLQERQLLACREFYPPFKLNLTKGELDELFPQLEKTRMYGPFCGEVMQFYAYLKSNNVRVVLGYDHETRREYMEF